VRCQVDRGVCINLNQHELIDEMRSEVGKVRDRWINFGEIADSGWSFGAKSICFNKDLCFFQPCKEVRFGAINLMFASVRLLST